MDPGSSLRRATVDDVATIVAFRRGMFEELDLLAGVSFDESLAAFAAYVERALPEETYLGWMAEAEGEVIGTSGLVFQTQPPHPLLRSETVGYVLNVFVVPVWRRRGVATALTRAAVEHCDAIGCGAVVLHASDAGQKVYERLGFKRTSEMRMFLG